MNVLRNTFALFAASAGADNIFSSSSSSFKSSSWSNTGGPIREESESETFEKGPDGKLTFHQETSKSNGGKKSRHITDMKQNGPGREVEEKDLDEESENGEVITRTENSTVKPPSDLEKKLEKMREFKELDFVFPDLDFAGPRILDNLDTLFG